MRWVTIGAGVLALTAAAVVAGQGDGEPARVAAARETVRLLSRDLRAALSEALETGSPVAAIGLCRVRAPAIAASVGARSGRRVGRTSLRYRNPANAPDPWERRVLASFEARKKAGEPPGRLEHHEVVERDGRRVFRYMKAIPTRKMCLACHGESLDPLLAARLDQVYPGDRARGFRVGDIRGAFTVEWELE